ncbi:hypothetical protein GFY24_36940 [Nocardia sp. SYP-A9097]|uniref:hypothetical protein n=1 Tax=Nocardia sp. SYP-A9097 TaxID=2663237 RepID=UPI00129A61AC|nr:hypothetical protein [Nocardia sp. SYP-A9097]MRH92944.1 hypothetical protein [Nocardia sp. SYP-A9097]
MRRIQDLAAEFVRVEALGADGYDGTDGAADQDWLDHLDALSAVRESTEHIARSLGVPQPWIERARDLGAGRSPAPDPEPAAEQAPSEAKQFYLDMLSVDLWNLQRMAFVVAARETRLAEGGYGFGADPVAGAAYRRNMAHLHTRISALADAAEITARDAEKLWDSAEVDDLRHVTAAVVNRWDDLTVESTWRRYTRADFDAALPPYIPVDSDGGKAAVGTGIGPPTPEQLIARATDLLHDTRMGAAASSNWHIEAAIDAALPSETNWSWGNEPPETRPATQEPERGHGPEP